ncbi:MAG: hypothetical protein BWX70_03227 [Verrucomicrobia bacterium ADurb.Bin070]|nr:MAG: hypothetical protein BWX70_03227 [Verrucomicrobia bacterium ADurb.Bin070]
MIVHQHVVETNIRLPQIVDAAPGAIVGRPYARADETHGFDKVGAQRGQHRIAQPEGHREPSLPLRHRQLIQRHPFGHPVREFQSVQRRAGHQQSVISAGIELSQTRLDCAADRLEHRFRETAQRARFAPRAADPHDRTGRQVGPAPPLRQHPGVARILAPRQPKPIEIAGQRIRQVLGAVHGQIDAPLAQGVVQIAREKIAGALPQVGGQIPVAGRLHRDRLKGQSREQRRETFERIPCLQHRKRAASRPGF